MNNFPIKIQLASSGGEGPIQMFVELSLPGMNVFADIEEIEGKTVVNLYPPPDNGRWTIPYDDFLAALVMGKERLQIK